MDNVRLWCIIYGIMIYYTKHSFIRYVFCHTEGWVMMSFSFLYMKLRFGNYCKLLRWMAAEHIYFFLVINTQFNQ